MELLLFISPERFMITIDCRWLGLAGIGTYLSCVIPRLIASMPEQQFCLLGNPEALITLKGDSLRVQVVPAFSPMYSISEQLELVRRIPKETDIFFSTHFP